MNVEIIPFSEPLAPRFKELNMAWLRKYFYVEAIDEEMLSHPKQHIIDKEGFIFFAKTDGEIAGTFALMKQADGSYELGKMAVDESLRGKKIGNAMLEFCLAEAKRRGIEKLILFSNTILLPAIHLYKKFGFEEVPVGQSEYKRSNIKMEKIL